MLTGGSTATVGRRARNQRAAGEHQRNALRLERAASALQELEEAGRPLAHRREKSLRMRPPEPWLVTGRAAMAGDPAPAALLYAYWKSTVWRGSRSGTVVPGPCRLPTLRGNGHPWRPAG